MNKFTSYVDSPIGSLRIISSQTHIEEVSFQEHDASVSHGDLPEMHLNCIFQLKQYFAGKLQEFCLDLNPGGTVFQEKVWRALNEIGWGMKTTYQALSDSLGDPKAIRAVATALGKNRIAIIIPCHRVIGSDGSMVGYASGIPRKEWLLRHEGVLNQLTLFD